MKDFYKQEIEKVAMEKIAARAWKKHFVGLSNPSYNRLLESGVYNPKKEVRGIEKGTQNILAKNNATLVRKPNKAAAAQIEIMKDYGKAIKEEIPDKDVLHIKSNAKNSNAYSMSRAIMPSSTNSLNKPLQSIGGKSGFVYAPKNDYNRGVYRDMKRNPELAQTMKESFGVKPISRRDRENKRWTQAITERHEADEIRYANNLAKKGKLDESAGFKPYFSHVSPKVLAQESTHVAMMPRNIKNNQLKAMRNIRYSDATAGTKSEAESISGLTGTTYGRSAVYDKAKANKAEKQWFNTGKF